ncbi:MAG TPA: heparinase II/III family protein [Terrimicrobiaceae bacterium]|nr:heparinase II/III family protein [Terrimicrobiaceae bacterium]
MFSPGCIRIFGIWTLPISEAVRTWKCRRSVSPKALGRRARDRSRTALVSVLCAGSLGAQELPTESLENLVLEKAWATENSQVEKVQADGQPALRWALDVGKTATLSLRTDHPLFARLRDYNRLEFDFRIIHGQVDTLTLRAMGHVSGSRQSKVHEWQLGITTTKPGIWQTRILDLNRPNWLVWDNPDGTDPHFLFDAISAVPGTVIELRRMRLSAVPLQVKPFFELPITWPVLKDGPDGGMAYTFQVHVQNTSGRPATIEAMLVSPPERFSVAIEPAFVEVKNAESAVFTVTAGMTQKDLSSCPELYSETVRVGLRTREEPDAVSTFEMPVTRPLPPGLQRQFILPEKDRQFLRKQLAAGDPATRKILEVDKTLAEADAFLAIRLDHIPTGHLRVDSWPVVPGTNPPVRYKIGSAMPEIINPATGERETCTPLAGQVWKAYLGSVGRITEKLGLAYAYTGDEKYAAKAVELLELYARQYKDLPWFVQGDALWNDGPAMLSSSRMATSSTYGSNMRMRWHIRMLGLIADSPSLTPEARQRIYDGFVLPYATEIAKFPGGISNMTDITNHNLLVLGLCFNDANLVRWALHTDSGVLSRLEDINRDGFTSEGRPVNYHVAAMDEFGPSLAHIAASGLPSESFKDRLLQAVRMPYQRATLWGVVPNSGDCGRGTRAGTSPLAEHVLALHPEEEWLLDLSRDLTLPAKIQRLITGREPKKDGYKDFLESKPRLFREAGLAILRTGETPETQIMATLDYGRNPGHGHLDRNQITLAAFGKTFTHGPGSLYNAGKGGMIRGSDPRLDSFCGPASIGQNVVLVDCQNQQPAIGELVAWSEAPENQFVTARVPGIAPGVDHTRTLALRDKLVIVIDRLESEQQHTYDFAYHNLGKLTTGPGWSGTAAGGPLAETANYANITGLQRLTGTGPIHLQWDLSDQVPAQAKSPAPSGPAKLALWQLPIPGSEAYTGTTGLNNPNTLRMPDEAPSLFTRTKGKTAVFVTVLEPYTEKPSVTAIEGDAEHLIIIRNGEPLRISLKDYAAKQ